MSKTWMNMVTLMAGTIEAQKAAAANKPCTCTPRPRK